MAGCELSGARQNQVRRLRVLLQRDGSASENARTKQRA
jgi:hypothetical protein